jgi:DNA replicative helicase MCM subunit Mcm2 (Cdc46/Mcm family)
MCHTLTLPPDPPLLRYDDLKSAHENIELQSTILSRFDLIFIVKDDRSEARDKQIAAHVLEVHRTAGRVKQQMEQTDQVGGGAGAAWCEGGLMLPGARGRVLLLSAT